MKAYLNQLTLSNPMWTSSLIKYEKGFFFSSLSLKRNSEYLQAGIILTQKRKYCGVARVAFILLIYSESVSEALFSSVAISAFILLSQIVGKTI